MQQPPGTVPPPHRPWGRRIKDSWKARWPGYPLAIVLAVVSYVIGEKANGTDRFFVERDPTISYPYRDDSVPSWALIFIGVVGPILLIFFAQTLIRRSPRGIYFDRRTKDLHLAFIVLMETLAVTYLITNIIKGYVGRLRPNFLAYCDYKGYRNAIDTSLSGNQDLLNAYFGATIPGAPGSFANCRREIKDAHYSFPSGHSSISFCGLTFLTLFLLHITSRINFTHHSVGKIVRFFIILVPLFSATLVAASRVVDYKHNVDDTVWGALIGMLGALLAFHANYSYSRPAAAGVPVTGGHIIPYPQHYDQFGNPAAQPPQQFFDQYGNPIPQQMQPQMGGQPMIYQNRDLEEVVPTTREHVGPITVKSPLVTKVNHSGEHGDFA